MNGAQYILHFLEQKQVHSVFGYPGGAIMPLYDAMLDSSIKHYLARHEQGAAFSAIGYARSTNSVGVCIGTSGPGATNLITSLADAMLDSVPLLVITGQVATSSMGSDAFQEVDVLGLSLSVCKHSELVTDIRELPAALEYSWELAQEGRPGPILLDVPKDVLLTELNDTDIKQSSGTQTSTTSEMQVIDGHQQPVSEINQLLEQAQKPLLYVGGGVAMAGAIQELNDFIERSHLPSVSTLKGLGCVPSAHPYYLGMLGMHGLPGANIAVQECDLLLVVGARLDDRATGKLDEFAPHAKVVHVDIDAAELGKRRATHIAIQADVKQILPLLTTHQDYDEWNAHLRQIKAEKAVQYSDFSASARPDAPSVLHCLSEKLPKNAVVACDVGQHQMWVAQHMQFTTPCNHLTSGGLGTMGFGLPAAIGAKVARPQHTVVSVSGDGSFMMNVQELGTLKRYGIPVKIIIMDNQRLGMVKQWQELFHEERYSETNLSCNPEFCALAQVFGLTARELTNNNQTEEALNWLLEQEGAALLHVRLDEQQNVWPIVPPNTANHKMWEQPSCNA
ncbi:acetolactate synthase 2 catalytic subunit [Alteromonas sp. a30]|uniref:acetolactate synthase 2 catalytic subunit n=1 Tax=Alteromonas sp. a30 TaxID=2730917 RepID=UPI00228072A1|nr:acetolactate synthase 2 catalytic subunit [Alteromonas sp. a30]MCY7294948.1 acetolactate synthase 2 catalytic subunit [Alteromonas sp. a30]